LRPLELRFRSLLKDPSATPGPRSRIVVPAPPERATEPPTDHARAQGETPRMSWARLLKRVFDIDIERCPNCGGGLKIIAAPSTRSGQASKIRR